ncbi:MAG: trypsin-like peptidase domain-containing protein [Fibrobacter sp.]|nr:trypsin-like peptidase domain-containing protein [Fibrobacter sp.]
MKHAIILIIGILATSAFAEFVPTYMTEADSGKADTVNMNVTKVYGSGIAFHEHYIVTTGDVARHAKKLAAIVVMVNNTPVVARVERSADTLFNKDKNEYLNMAILQVDNDVPLNACKIEERLIKVGELVTVTGFPEDSKKVQVKSLPAKVVADSTFPEHVASAINVKLPSGFGGAALSSHGKVIGMVFGYSTRKPNTSFFYDGILMSEYILHRNKPTTTDISKCVYQVRSYVPVE